MNEVSVTGLVRVFGYRYEYSLRACNSTGIGIGGPLLQSVFNFLTEILYEYMPVTAVYSTLIC